MDILKNLSKYFIITLAIMFVCSFVVLVDKIHKIKYDVFDVLETYKALKYFFILGLTAFTASVAYNNYQLGSMGVKLTYTLQPTTIKDSLIYIYKKYCCTNMQTRHGIHKQRYVNSPMNTVSGRATRQVCIYHLCTCHIPV